MSRLLTVVLTICLAGNFSFLYAQDDSDVKQYITENATQLWGNYLKALRKGVEGDVRIRTSNGELGPQYDIHVIREKKWGLEETEDTKENISRVESFADRYHFNISRKADSQDWTVDSVEKTSPGTITNIKDYSFPTGEEQGRIPDYELCQHIFKGYSLGISDYVPTLLRLPEFTIESAEKVNRDGADYYQVNFSFDQPDLSALEIDENDEFIIKYPKITVKSGSLLLTTDYLLIKEAKIDTIHGPREIENDYKIVDGVPLISEYHLTIPFDGGDYKETYAFDLRIGTNYGSSRFKLSYYGLSEPNFGDGAIAFARYVLLIAGLVLIGFGATRIIQRRRS